MREELRRTYLIFFLPPLFLVLLFYFLTDLKLLRPFDFHTDKTLSVILFTAAVTFGVAIPIFLRGYRFSKLRKKRFSTHKEFLKDEKLIIGISSFSIYFAILTGLFHLDSLYTAGATLSAIYAIYFHYPSKKKILFDLKIFKVIKTNEQEELNKKD